jgi:hypothetical protein
MLPALLVIVLVMAFPLAYLLFMSVHKWSMVGYEPPSFVGDSAASSGQLEVDFAGDQIDDGHEIAQ